MKIRILFITLNLLLSLNAWALSSVETCVNDDTKSCMGKFVCIYNTKPTFTLRYSGNNGFCTASCKIKTATKECPDGCTISTDVDYECPTTNALERIAAGDAKSEEDCKKMFPKFKCPEKNTTTSDMACKSATCSTASQNNNLTKF